ncbi:MAG: alanine/glycine:cation symporter family protein, partial [Blautia sp.]
TYILIFLLVGCGLYYSIRTRFVQVRGMKDVLSILKEKSTSEEGDAKQVSSFQALMISTASRVGTGNIAGIATALAAGGPGAVFWMWLMAIVGGSSAFAESTLAQIYKVKDGADYRGGPSYYIERALHSRKLGVLFSVALIACFSYGFNGLQSYNISSALPYYIDNYNETIWPAIIGLILAVLTGLVIFGGVHRIGTITSVIVPIMAIGYILLGLYMTVTNITLVPSVLALVFKEALDPQAIAGGFAGSAVVIGIKRGLFSNEAGMGSAPNAAASAEVSHPAKQGLVQTLSVFIDTLVICSTTAMMLLVSQVPGESGVLDGIPYVQAAVKTSIGELGIHFITLAIFFFAFSSLVGNYYYAESNIRFIKDNKTVLNVGRCTCLVAIFLGAQADFSTVWNLADILMGFMAIINIFAILALSNIVIRTLKNYEKQRKEGKDPVFKASDVGLDNTDCWK